ncbi:GTPase [Azospirillum halopraeferens]|uniref:GTPase n=1 Tax=Azospirillum halopraeferens TaxID=34010 RepID=UPI000407E4BB|nr:GTPase [Azospirillum halopraeferens]
MSLAYARYHDALRHLLGDADVMISRSAAADAVDLRQRLAEQRARLDTHAPLRIVLIGEFSAGKSSIIAALTGAHLKIDADVATDSIAEYPWRGLVLVDTPGVQAQVSDTDHDAIAREATVGADLVLFVITNELFNPRLADHLSYILAGQGLGLAGKTCIVVNKMDRESNPDEVILSEVGKVLGPYPDVPVHLCAASKYLQAADAPDALRGRFLRQSRMDEMIAALDRFIADSGTVGRLSTPLSVASDILDRLQSDLGISEDDQKRLELIRRRRRVLDTLQGQLANIRKTWKQEAYSAVMSAGDRAVKQLSDISNAEDLEALFELGMKEAAGQVDTLYDGVEREMRDALREASDDLAEIGESPLAQDVARLDARGQARAGVSFDGTLPSQKDYVLRFAKNVGKPLEQGLNAMAKNASGLRDIVYQVGKTLGVRFRPYGAVNAGKTLAKVAGAAGKAVPFLMVALDFYLQYSEEKAKEERARYAASLRVTLRNAFADQAKVEAEALEAVVLTVSQGPVRAGIEELDAEAERIACQRSERKELQQEIAALRRRCTALRDELLGGPGLAQEAAATPAALPAGA